MRLLSILKVLWLICGITLMIFGLLLMMLMIVLPGFVMVVLGIGLLTNQLLRSIRLLAVLVALLIFYKIAASHLSPLANSLLWLSLALALLLYAIFAQKIQYLLMQSMRKSAHHFFKL